MDTNGARELFCAVMCGYPGVGKSIVAQKLSELLPAVPLRTDDIRRYVISEIRYDSKGVFRQEDMQKVYQVMLRVAWAYMKEGMSVVLDATFAKRENRMRTEQLAKELDASLMFVYVSCRSELVQGRLKDGRGDDASRATYEHHLAYKKGIFEPFKPEERTALIEVSNNGSPADLDSLLSEIVTGVWRTVRF